MSLTDDRRAHYVGPKSTFLSCDVKAKEQDCKFLATAECPLKGRLSGIKLSQSHTAADKVRMNTFH